MDQAHRNGRNAAAGNSRGSRVDVRAAARDVKDVALDATVAGIDQDYEYLHEPDNGDLPRTEQSSICTNDRHSYDLIAGGDKTAVMWPAASPDLDGSAPPWRVISEIDRIAAQLSAATRRAYETGCT